MMKKIFVLITIAGILCLPAISGAQEKMAVGVKLGGVWPTDPFDDVDASGDFIFGADFTYLFNDVFGIRAGVDYYNYDVDDAGTGTNLGDVTVIPLSIGVMARKKIGSFAPYIGIGGSYLINDISDNDPVNEFSIDNNFGFFVNGGVEAFINQNMAIGLDLRYLWADADVEVNGRDTDESADLDAFSAMITFRYYF